MNKAFRSVWNDALQTFVAAPETARTAAGASAGGSLRTARPRLARGALAVAMAFGPLTAFAAPPAATQLPTGGQVAAGSAQIGTSGASMTVDQASQRAVLNWQSFDVGSSASVNFRQPDASSVTLNRVVGSDPSQVYGRMTANGQVFLVNPAGIYFSPSASVDVGGLVATTHSISTADFMAGKSTFSANGATGTVVNEGRLGAAPGGYIALLAPEVRNSGAVVARLGTVALAAGEAFTLQFDGNSLAALTVAPSQWRALVENRQAVQAEGGLVVLSAQALNALQGSVVNSGSIDASSLQNVGGRIVLDGGQVELAAGSSLRANGPRGGGTVQVGSLAAQRVAMAADARIEANATAAGDGGNVTLLTDLHDTQAATTAHGSLQARGAGAGRHGGTVDTSGANVDFQGIRVDTGTPGGRAGTWLVDPYDLTVDSAAAATISSNLATSNVTLQTTASSSSGPGVVNTSGNGDITVNSAINWSSTNSLTLDAYRDVVVNAGLLGGGAINLKASREVAVGGVTLRTNGRDITLWSNATSPSTSVIGGIYLKNNTVLDSRTAADRAAGNTSTASGGGAITLGGGSNTATLASGTVVPTGYAVNSASGNLGAVQLGTQTAGSPAVGQNANVRVYSGGGDISMAGHINTTARNTGFGIEIYSDVVIDAGTNGNLSLDGSATVAVQSGAGLDVGRNAAGFLPIVLRTHDGNISIAGTASGAAASNNGVNLTGDTTNLVTLAATGAGAIDITGSATGAGALDFAIGGTDILAASGPITLTGEGAGPLLTGLPYVNKLGSKPGSLVTSSTSQIILTDDSFSLLANSGFRANTSGVVLVQPLDDNFSGTFNLLQNGNATITPASTASVFQIGRDSVSTPRTDTVNVNTDVSIAGRVGVIGGTVNLPNSITSRASR
ncbi:filamentous hemagglutinin N-terminal domain-containing protein [Pseudorhodoferax sp. Leaf274]|uniref:two-partner secretion domain-containing protein n=1 Tax=Pseudorhodoferax sp. Leaf274 TaxID=1736318 RepID=UPI000702F99E|nr:filamentous hemagglutinin N-terminal domain-containing protein [Pseudorhodoferax sp. Leaf274]KQP38896.1 hypothetical protein ASF44_10660 [Pseudorhodoferax sp. Leaf274]